MNIIALSNEGTFGSDPDIPWALSGLQDAGLIADHVVYSTPTRVRDLGSAGAAKEVAELVSQMRPDALMFFHSGSCRFDEQGLDAIRSAYPGAVWLYHEGDAFARFTFPYSRQALLVSTRCQAAFLFCDGYLARLLRRAHVPFVTYTPSWVNHERFPCVWSVEGPHDFDIAFIGNDVRSRIRRIPGARQRAELVALLQRRYGSRAAIYGQGWTGPGARGSCSLDEVSSVYRAARVAIGIDHSVGAYQFSNRLPIALACGIPLAHSWFEGVSQILPGFATSQFFSRNRSAMDLIDALLETDPRELADISVRGRHLAVCAFGCDVVLRHMLEVAFQIRQGNDPDEVPNPWLAGDALLGMARQP